MIEHMKKGHAPSAINGEVEWMVRQRIISLRLTRVSLRTVFFSIPYPSRRAILTTEKAPYTRHWNDVFQPRTEKLLSVTHL